MALFNHFQAVAITIAMSMDTLTGVISTLATRVTLSQKLDNELTLAEEKSMFGRG